jgi:hypothetical protein
VESCWRHRRIATITTPTTCRRILLGPNYRLTRRGMRRGGFPVMCHALHFAHQYDRLKTNDPNFWAIPVIAPSAAVRVM